MPWKTYWSPRYLYDRFRFDRYQRRNMDKPWLTPAAIELLDTLLVPTDVGIEWGSGRSTIWFSRKLKHLTSVERDGSWYEQVGRMLRDQKITNVDYQHHPVEDEAERDTPYVHVGDRFADGSVDFALVDGAARGMCANAAVPKISPGGLLVVDNINWFLDYPTRSPASRTGQGPRDEYWAAFESRVSGWRRIITSSGVSDTAIWIRPSVGA